MRDSWEEKALGELVSFQKGKISEQSSNQIQGFVPVINTETIGGKISVWANPNGSVTCSNEDILMLWDGERSGLVATGFKGVVGSTFSRLSIKTDIHKNFLFYFLNDKFKWIQNQRTGTGVPHVPKDLKSILSVRYPKEVIFQSKIANILKNIDSVIEKTEVAIAKYQALKQGMMQDLFTRGIDLQTGKLRPSQQEAPHLYKKESISNGGSDNLMIPKDWKVSKLSDIIFLRHGYQFRDYDFVEEGIEVVKIGQIGRTGRLNLDKTSKIKANRIKEFEGIRLFNGDILMALTGATLGKTALVKDIDKPLVQNYRVGYFTPKDIEELDKSFLYYLLIGESVQNEILGFVNTGAQGNIGKADFEKIKVSFPTDIEEQREIGKRMSRIEDLIEKEQANLNKHQTLKKGLMQDLLTGKVEVEV